MKHLVKRLGVPAIALALLLAMAPAGALPVSAADERTQTAASLMADGAIRFQGRSMEVGTAVTFDWSAAGFEFVYTGGGTVTANITSTNDSTVEVTVNGRHRRAFVAAGTGDVVLAAGLPEGTHTITVNKVVEASDNRMQLNSLTFPADGALRATPAGDYRFEFIGDSITCGAGARDGAEDGVYAYPALVSRAFHADWNTVSRSGVALVPGGGREVAAEELWESVCWYRDRTAEWDHSTFIPDVVVVNLSTNDLGFTDIDTFVTHMKAFTQKLRATYPDAHIVWAIGLMTTHRNYIGNFRAAVDEMQPTVGNLSFLEFPALMSGGAAHPNVEEHAVAAKLLSAHLADVLGVDDPLEDVDLAATPPSYDYDADLTAAEEALGLLPALDRLAYTPASFARVEAAAVPLREMQSLAAVPLYDRLANGSFEEDLAVGWTVEGNASRQSGQSLAYDWSNSLTSFGSAEYTLSQEITGLPDGVYEFSVMTRGRIEAGQCSLGLLSGGGETTATMAEQATGSGYMRQSVQGQVTGGSCTVSLTVRSTGSDAPRIDYASFVPVAQDAADRAAAALRTAVQELEASPVDFSALDEAVQKAEALRAEDYTTASWDAFLPKLQTARQALLAIDGSTQQTTVDAALQAFRQAQEALVKRADPTALQEAIDQAEALRKGEYTTPSWDAMQQKLTAAKAAAADPNATQAQVDLAAKELSAAIEALVRGVPDDGAMLYETGFEGQEYPTSGIYEIDGVDVNIGWGGSVMQIGDDARSGSYAAVLGGWGRVQIEADFEADTTYLVEGYYRNCNAAAGELRVWLMDETWDSDYNISLGGVTLTPAANMPGYEKFSFEMTTEPGFTGGYLMFKWQNESSAGVYIDDVTIQFQGGEQPDFESGDVNGDGKVNSSDARLVLQYTVELISLTEEQLARANMNGDSLVNSSDARMILQATVELATLPE